MLAGMAYTAGSGCSCLRRWANDSGIQAKADTCQDHARALHGRMQAQLLQQNARNKLFDTLYNTHRRAAAAAVPGQGAGMIPHMLRSDFMKLRFAYLNTRGCRFIPDRLRSTPDGANWLTKEKTVGMDILFRVPRGTTLGLIGIGLFCSVALQATTTLPPVVVRAPRIGGGELSAAALNALMCWVACRKRSLRIPHSLTSFHRGTLRLMAMHSANT